MTVVGLLTVAIAGIAVAGGGTAGRPRDATLLDATKVHVKMPNGDDAAPDVWVDATSEEVIAEVAVPSLMGLSPSTVSGILEQVWEQVPGRFDRVVLRDLLQSREWVRSELETMFGARELDSASGIGDGSEVTRDRPGDCIKDPAPPSTYEGQLICNKAPTAMVSDQTVFALGDVCPGLMVQPISVTEVFWEPDGSVVVIWRVGLPGEFSGLLTANRARNSDVADIFCNLIPAAQTSPADVGRHFLDLTTLQEVAAPGAEQSGQSKKAEPSTHTMPQPATPDSRWSDPALWEMDCTGSANPSKVDVHHVATGDVTGDDIDDTVVAASCIASTSAWPDSVTLFDGAGSDSATLINADTAPRRPIVESLAIENGEIGVKGTLLSRNASFCCPDLRFSDTFVVTGKKWRRTSHEVWPEGQQPPAKRAVALPDTEDRVGYGDVKIGMSQRELLATGEVTGKEAGGCSWYSLSYGGEAVYSPTLGQVVAIFFQDDMTTSKGIHLGSTQEDVNAAYPEHGKDIHGYWTTEITPDVDYVIGISGGEVSELILQSNDQDCYG